MLFVGKKSSLLKQLLAFLIVSIVLLSLTNSIVAGWIASSQSSKVLERQSFQIADNLAQNSILALLTESQENAQEAVTQVLNFSDVIGVAIFTEQGTSLIKQGDIEWSAEQLSQWLSQRTPQIVAENASSWVISNPVFLLEKENELTELDLSGTPNLFLGHAVINVSKSSLQSLTSNLFSNILIIGLIFAVLLVWLQNAGLKRLIAPLVNLSETMNRARTSGEHTFARVEGARELRQIARNYNAMMQVLEKQEDRLIQMNAGLESEVEIRTQELTHARDTALVAVRTQSEFLANISHELRTPLQAIIGYIELVREELEQEAMDQQVSDLDSALASSTRLLTLINSILDLAKCESGQMDLITQQTSLFSLLSETEKVIHPLAAKHHNQLTLVSPGRDYELQIDKEKTLQILLNLLSNACKFTEHGQIRLTTQIDQHMITWSIKDTGIGIAADKQALIFDKFRQIDGSVKRRHGGTGLGLAISRHFAEVMGGSITVTSTLNKGSEFIFKLPLKPAAPNHVLTEKEPLES